MLNVPVRVAPLLPICAASTVVPVSVPLSVSPVNVPTAVMLLCVLSMIWLAVPAVIAELAELLTLAWTLYCALATVPVTLAPVTLLIAAPSPTRVAPLFPISAAFTVVPVSVPDKVNPVNVPSDVIFVCAAVLNVPVSVAPELPICAASTIVPVSAPLSVSPVSVPKLVILV